MLEFRKIEKNDRDVIKRILAVSDFRGCEYSFANNLAWHRLYDAWICIEGGFYISMVKWGGLHFSFPAGEGDLPKLIAELRLIAESENVPLSIGSLSNEHIELFRELYGDSFDVSEDEGDADYIYRASDLRDLKGRKYHGKRNHLKKIESAGFSYSPLTEADFDGCIVFAAEEYNKRGGYSEKSLIGEQYALNTFFENFGFLGLSGGVLRIDGRIAAFTIGEQINSDTLDIHIEKADISKDGTYAAINNYYAVQASQGLEYINREEDLGIEGLRKSKQSYHPLYLLRKYTATFR